MAALPNKLPIIGQYSRPSDSRAILGGEASNEIIFAVVGGAGSGTSFIAKTLRNILVDANIDAPILKASKVILEWAVRMGKPIPPPEPKTLRSGEILQDYGDEMREGVGTGRPDNSAVALGLIIEIQRTRAEKVGVPFEPGREVFPDGTKRAYILDSIRHSAEVHLLRQVYGDAFVLIGVVCDQSKREERMRVKYDDGGAANAQKFMRRDNADDGRQHGQHVGDAFHLADFFVDNTNDRETAVSTSNREWKANEDLSRLVKIVTGTHLERPRLAETAMYHAFSTQMQSACLSRQVGAALVDQDGNIAATGANEVPKAGGGVYGESANPDSNDSRCAFFENPDQRYCRNTREQNNIVTELIQTLEALNISHDIDKEILAQELRRTRIGGLLEFSRAVHAEMDALLSAARKGVALVGTRLFVTTYPCHYCARHIVTAGVDEVQFIEPYPKSQALKLHQDSITTEGRGWKPPSDGGTHVLFHPFTGVSPRLYRRAFLMSGELKDKKTGDMRIHEPHWISQWYLPKIGYVSIEAKLVSENRRDV